MDGHFDELLRRIKLTKAQRDDALKKYRGVAKKLHDSYYDSEYSGSTKLLIGSYGKKTNIRPPGDVDLLFKIPLETYNKFFEYESNGPAALLQEIRRILNTKYTTTEEVKAWGKVVLVKTADGTHDVELLPAIEIDNIYIIPNSENGGSWDSFDVKAEIDAVSNSNRETDGLTRRLIRILKCWKQQNSSMNLKSYQIEEFCVSFLRDTEDIELLSVGELIAEFLEYLQTNYAVDPTFVKTAYARSQKALLHEVNEQYVEACYEWKKVFGVKNFPSYYAEREKIHLLRNQYPSETEEFIEDIHRIKIRDDVELSIKANVNFARKSFRDINWPFIEFIRRFSAIPPKAKITFEASISHPEAQLLWKVRNFGNDAKREEKGLRGQIDKSDHGHILIEPTAYHGVHYVECYAILDNKCVAISRYTVPISKTLEIGNG